MRLSAAMTWSAIAALALAVLPLLARNLAMIPAHVPLDPNEGWNAAHALSAMAGAPLYPPPGAQMVNNYPPLSFYIVGAMAKLTGDAIVAGRLLAGLAFLLVCGGIACLSRQMECGARSALFAMLFFAGVLLIGSDYVAMDDPQLLGHAVQIAGLGLALRHRPIAAAALFAASLFIKHNLLALPLATGLWLLWQERRAGLQYLLWGTAFALAGLVAFRLGFGVSLWSQLATPRLSSAANLRTALLHLWWAPLPLLTLQGLREDRFSLFCFLYAAIALALGLVFAAGDGVDSNAFFDLALALSLALGLILNHGRRTVLAAASALPLLAFLAFHVTDNNFFFTRDFAAQSARDIAFLQAHPGPALCDQLSLCLWAGKGAEVDVFNVGEAIKRGARDSAPLAAMIASRHFAAIQLGDLDALGPQVRAALQTHYRPDHADDNGLFLIPDR
ncbi:MAG TPA: glycosyltransferase family 39 protein [Rhizomicrobium sp.]